MAKSSCSKSSSSKKKSYKFYNMDKRALGYPVMCGKGVAIPAGATGVRIAFGQSHLQRWDEGKQKYVPMNVYLWNKPGRGMIMVHA